MRPVCSCLAVNLWLCIAGESFSVRGDEIKDVAVLRKTILFPAELENPLVKNHRGLAVQSGIDALRVVVPTGSEHEASRLLCIYRFVSLKEPKTIFGFAITQASLVRLTTKHSRAQLVMALATYCPPVVNGNAEIEYWLAFLSKDELRDGILVLFDAFEKSEAALVQGDIYDALSRAFVGIGTPMKKIANKEDVEHLRKWYLKNHDKLSVDPRYSVNYGFFRTMSERTPLFVVR